MGYMKHHAIIVTGWDENKIKKAHYEANNIFFDYPHLISPIIPVMNGYSSFFIAPDGSKEGWTDSDTCEKYRDDFINYLNTNKEVEWLEYVEIAFGGDGDYNEITNSNVKYLESLEGE